MDEVFLAKLDSSGLTEADAEQLGMVYVPSAVRLHGSFKPLPALQIKYFHPQTRQPLQCLPNWPNFYRIRYLKLAVDFSQSKPIRYTQEPNSGVGAYFPTNVNWGNLLTDYSQPLLITEGELKAAKACKEGYPTIGLGGVHNFRSTHLGISFLKELQAVTWARRRVYIVYDSDYKTNPAVCKAVNQLAAELIELGAIPYYVCLPSVYGDPDKKTGLDDFLVHRPAAELQLHLQQAQPLSLTEPLWELNKRMVFVRDPALVIDRLTYQKMAPSTFKDYIHAYQQVCELHLKEGGQVQMRKTSASAAWLKWPFRAEAAKLTYAPGQPQEHKGQFNTWRGWGCQPVPGDVAPWVELIDQVFQGAEPELKLWFLRWCAYPIQYPGVKMFTSVVLHGVHQGAGKSLIGVTLGRIYGENYTKINQRDLQGAFNGWAENRQFALGEEITGSDRRQDADFLKGLITQLNVRINVKYVAEYVVPDCINYLFTSNHPDAFFLEDSDRRFAIHEVVAGGLSDDFAMEYSLWLDTDGPSALFDWLLKFDLGDFNPAARAPKTMAKARMIQDVKSDLGAWVEGLIMNPDTVLQVGGIKLPHDVYTSRQLLDLYDPLSKTRVTAQGLGTALKRRGVRQVAGGMPLRVGDTQDRYYAIRNPEKWLSSPPMDVVRHLKNSDVF